MQDNVGLMGCRSGVIATASGQYFDVLQPDPDKIFLSDIALALSKICRFGGHPRCFYSVAEHCVNAARLAQHREESVEVVRAVLLHDATEAYIGDVVKPLKNALADVYAPIEQRLQAAIGERFGVDFDATHERIKFYDYTLLFAEKRSLFPDTGTKWECEDNYPAFAIEPACEGETNLDLALGAFLLLADEVGLR